jgi:hypothetical protein
MDPICLANTCKGTRCKRNKVSAHFCKIHTTNEVCETCGSDFISSTESIRQSTGKSLCVFCIRARTAKLVAEAQLEAEEQAKEHKIRREAMMREHSEKMRALLEKHKDVMQQYAQTSYTAQTPKTHIRQTPKTPMQMIVDEIF